MNITKLPNIILIVCDTLSAKHMSLYGYDRRTTPNLERLIEEKGFTVYESCYSTSCWTPPTHASIFTGLYPHEHGVHELNYALPDNLITLPEVLKMMGYYTVGISCNGIISVPTNFNKGFDVFVELERWQLFNQSSPKFQAFLKYLNKEERGDLFFKSIETLRWAIKNKNMSIPVKHILNFVYCTIKGPNKCWFGVTKNATPYTLKALRKAKNTLKKSNTFPIFMFINLMQTHHKYNPPKPYKYKWSSIDSPYKKHTQNMLEHYSRSPFPSEVIEYFRDLYDEEILFLDSLLYQFVNGIDLDNNLIIITSDHGEHFGEKGHLNHILSLHDPVVKVPLLIKYPFNSKYEVDSSLVQINDIYATIMDLVCCPMPTPLSSKSLLSSEKREKAYMEIVHPEVWLNLIKDGRFKNEKFVRIVDGVK